MLLSSFIMVSVPFSRDIDGAMVTPIRIDPSSRIGINSVPSKGRSVRLARNTTKLIKTTVRFLPIARINRGRYIAFNFVKRKNSLCFFL